MRRRRPPHAPRPELERRPSAAGNGWRAAVLVTAALAAGSAAYVFPLTPGFSPGDTGAAIVAASVVAGLAIGVVALAWTLAPRLAAAPPRDRLAFAAALLSAGAATIHFAVARPHFDEYVLFGVFFLVTGVGQLVWPLWFLVSGWRPLVALGALGNGAIALLWGVDRIWGLPLGPDPWTPEPVGFGDGVASAFELLLAAACIALLLGGRRRRPNRSQATALALGAAAVTALSLLSVLGVWASILAPTT